MKNNKSLQTSKLKKIKDFIPTLNQTGYMTSQLDIFSQEFINYAKNTKNPVLDVGAAYGIATLAALSKGATIVANDIDERHLSILKSKVPSNDLSRLTLSCGAFPDEMHFPENYFDAILISRVLHLFNGEMIERSIRKAYQLLKPQGKLFIIAETPYLKICQSFIPVYEEKVKKGEKWPGLIEETKKFIKSSEVKNLPIMINLLDVQVLDRVLSENKFLIEKINLIGRNDFPLNRQLDGREGVGAIACKA